MFPSIGHLPKSLRQLAKDFLKSKIYEAGHVAKLHTVISHLRRQNRGLDQYRRRFLQRETVIRRMSRQLLAFREFRQNQYEYTHQRQEIQKLQQRISTLSRTLRSIRSTRRQLTKDNQTVRRWYQTE